MRPEEKKSLPGLFAKELFSTLLGSLLSPYMLILTAVVVFMTFFYVDYSGNGDLKSYDGAFIAETCSEKVDALDGKEHDEKKAQGCMTVYSKSFNHIKVGEDVCLDPNESLRDSLERVVNQIKGNAPLQEKPSVEAIKGALMQEYPCYY